MFSCTLFFSTRRLDNYMISTRGFCGDKQKAIFCRTTSSGPVPLVSCRPCCKARSNTCCCSHGNFPLSCHDSPSPSRRRFPHHRRRRRPDGKSVPLPIHAQPKAKANNPLFPTHLALIHTYLSIPTHCVLCFALCALCSCSCFVLVLHLASYIQVAG